MLSRRPEILWVLLVALVLLLAVWWIPGSSSVNTDSYSVAYGGKKVLYQALGRVDDFVARSPEQLVPDDSFGTARILILGPARYPTDEEWEQLYDAVQYGNSVVLAVQSGDPNLDAGPFNVSVVGQSQWEGLEDLDGETGETGETSEAEAEAESEYESPVTFSELMGQARATSRLVSGDVVWNSSGRIEMDNPDDWDVLVTAGSDIQAVQRRIGGGMFTLIASDDIFSNGAMVQPERALLAWRILESASSGYETLFDESLNGSGVPKVLGLLFDPLFRPMTLQLVLLAVLFGWLGSRRFGPAQRTAHGRRRSIVEHAQAVGTLYFTAGAGGHAVKCLHEFMKQELRSRFGQGFQVDNAERVARVAQADHQEVQQLFDEIRQFPNTKQSSAVASRLLGRLSQLLAGIRHQADGDSR